MKKIVFTKHNIIELDKVKQSDPIFAKEGNKITGMVIEDGDVGWILKIGGRYAANGHHRTLRECLESCQRFGYEFFVQEES